MSWSVALDFPVMTFHVMGCIIGYVCHDFSCHWLYHWLCLSWLFMSLVVSLVMSVMTFHVLVLLALTFQVMNCNIGYAWLDFFQVMVFWLVFSCLGLYHWLCLSRLFMSWFCLPWLFKSWIVILAWPFSSHGVLTALTFQVMDFSILPSVCYQFGFL